MIHGSDENYPGESLERLSEEDKETYRELTAEPCDCDHEPDEEHKANCRFWGSAPFSHPSVLEQVVDLRNAPEIDPTTVTFSAADIVALTAEPDSDLALAVARAAEEEEAKAQLAFVRGQRDALLLAAQASLMFHTVGGLVTIDDLQRWRALTEEDFSAEGLVRFIQKKMKEAHAS